MSSAPVDSALEKLAALRIELVEHAYALELQGRLDAADVALATSVRVAEVSAELEASVVGLKAGI